MSGKCIYCIEEINEAASICHYCGRYQNKIYNIFKSFLSFSAVIMVVISLIQVFLTYRSMAEAKLKRIEAKEVLDEANMVLKESKEKIDMLRNYINETISIVDQSAERKINSIDKSIGDKLFETQENINTIREKFANQLAEITNNTNKITTEISSELATLKRRTNLMKLSDDAIANGQRDSLDKLFLILNGTSSAEDKDIALSEIMRIKSFHASISRVEIKPLIYNNGTSEFKDLEIALPILTNTLLNHTEWTQRYLASVLLKTVKKIEVVEAYVISIKNEKRLEVLKASIAAFKAITGYTQFDIFATEELLDWWNKNKKQIEKDLQS